MPLDRARVRHVAGEFGIGEDANIRARLRRRRPAFRLDAGKQRGSDVYRRILPPVVIQRVEPGQCEALPDVLPRPTGRGGNIGVRREPIYRPAGFDSPDGETRLYPLLSMMILINSLKLPRSINGRNESSVMSG